MRRRWHQFSLRSVLLGVLVVAALLALWRWLAEPYREQRTTLTAIVDAGGQAESEPGGPSWLRAIVGDAWFQDVVAVDLAEHDASEALVDRVCRLPALRALAVSGPALTDQRLDRLRTQNSLRELVVGRPAITRRAADDFEQARPDVTFRIALSFAELAPPGGEKCHRQVSWAANVEGGDSVSEIAKRWTGKMVRITGVSAGYHYQEVEISAGRVGISGMTLRATHPAGWIDVIPPPWEALAVRFRDPIPRQAAESRLTLDGSLEIAEGGRPAHSNYSLGQAILIDGAR